MGKIIFKIFVLVCVFSGCSKNTIDKIYYNGTIWTGDYEAPYATAMVLNQEKFIFVGQDADAMDMASDQTEMIDLKGNFVTPGFIDNHVHFISGGLQLSRVNLNDVSSKQEFQEKIVDFHKRLPENSWILGGNWDHELWGGIYPDKSWIDEVVSDRPVFLDRLDGHMGLANTKAMNIAGIHASTLDPSGGVIVRDQNGNPTGVLKDLAMDLVLAILPEESDEEMDRALDRAMEYALSLGITQVHDMGSWKDLETYRRNYEKDKLKIRIKIYPWYTNWRDIIKYVEDYGPGDDWLRWNGMKGMMDGSLGSRTAWMHEPYLHAHNNFDKEKLPTLGVLTIKDTTEFKFF